MFLVRKYEKNNPTHNRKKNPSKTNKQESLTQLTQKDIYLKTVHKSIKKTVYWGE